MFEKYRIKQTKAKINSLIEDMKDKLCDFEAYIRGSQNASILTSSSWYWSIVARSTHDIECMNPFIEIPEILDERHKDAQKNHQDIVERLNFAKCAANGVAEKIRENDTEFVRFWSERDSRFVTITPMFCTFEGKEYVYMSAPELRQDQTNGLHYAEGFSFRRGCADFHKIFSADYSVADMTEDEFTNEYIKRRVQYAGITKEYEITEYIDKLRELFIATNGPVPNTLGGELTEMAMPLVRWMAKRGFFRDDLCCDLEHQVSTFVEQAYPSYSRQKQ